MEIESCGICGIPAESFSGCIREYNGEEYLVCPTCESLIDYKQDHAINNLMEKRKSKKENEFDSIGDVSNSQPIFLPNTQPNDVNPQSYLHSNPQRSLQQTGRTSVKFSEGETHIKTYHCAQLSFPPCSGEVTVTNKRVIFHGSSHKGRVLDEVKIDTISAISSMYGTKIRKFLLAVGIIFFIVGVRFTVENYTDGLLSALTASLLCLGFSIRRVFTLKIFSSSASGAPISIGEGAGYSPFTRNEKGFSIVAKPSEGTDRMMLELGALVSDLQTMGDLAIEKWK